MRVGARDLSTIVAIAVGAAWRPAILITAIVAVPTCAVYAVLDSVGALGVSPVAAVAVSAILGSSVVVHEAGHALAVRLLAARHPVPGSCDPGEMLPAGSWTSGRILRWSFGPSPDAAVAAAGPAAGAVCAVPALAFASTAPWSLPLLSLFLIHLLALRRGQPDGAQFAELLCGTDRP